MKTKRILGHTLFSALILFMLYHVYDNGGFAHLLLVVMLLMAIPLLLWLLFF